MAEKMNHVLAPEYTQPAPYTQDQIPMHAQQPQQFYQPQAAYAHPSGYANATPLQSIQKAPTPVDCPTCGQREMTRTEAVTGKTTHGWAAVLCCCACIGCLPYLMSSLKDVNHFCGKCGVMLATWHNSGRVEVIQAQSG
ncbi:hypothetical protein NUU61_003589 [Penicillium alfredii]|uniref:LITAF domain-containing protein n=1 Tax=Penicillium alfredii TaxID=1506179 RepID=A0A9W9FJN0_9EURO|nr:uncharacterized protein NUU61_003589 [Penicillium alfredii]KAJ5101367.1 hypothetical protein NUU61_003589 [Penicillium alfredii]